MGLLKRLTDRVLSRGNTTTADTQRKELLRRCYFEVMEQRRVLSADPVVAAVTYLEGDAGQDTTPDHFEVTFEGGSDTTQMTQFIINGDQDSSGNLTDGDMFFDVDGSLPGAGGSHAFQFDAANSFGVTAADIQGVVVSADGLSLTVDVENFEAGDVLAFTIDVDEVERYRTDKIASGVEFEGSFFEAQFVDQHYDFSGRDIAVDVELENGFVQSQQEGIFFDEYDQLLAAGESDSNGLIGLNRDNQTGHADRTAGAVDAYDLVAKPITISGTVYHDENLNCELDASESGIAGVDIHLQLRNPSTGAYETVATTKTDAQGNYEFGENLGLEPGDYQLVEVQPDGFLDAGAEAGSEGGVVEATAGGHKNVLSNISIPLGGTDAVDYDFKEIRPASISGHVWHDRNDDGVFDTNEEGIANVLIEVRRVGAKADAVEDPFADAEPIYVRTDANGFYEVEQLPPGIYEVVEINNYPGTGVDPLAGYLDGKDSVGMVGGTANGQQSNDRFTQIELCADDAGVRYDFGELKPVSVSGYVSVETPEGDCLDPTDPNYVGIGGVTIELYDDQGTLVATTQTDGAGHYEFSELPPGTYTLVEVQPEGYLNGHHSAGRVDGQTTGNAGSTDTYQRYCAAGRRAAKGFATISASRSRPSCAVPCTTIATTTACRTRANCEGIEGVRLQLFDTAGNVIAEQFTDAAGNYCFNDLIPGEYCVKEFQPGDYLDGKDSAGSVNGFVRGQAVNDEICKVTLSGGESGTDYNFGELLPGEISGQVHVDQDGDCVYDPGDGERPLANVTLELLNADGDVVATTKTDAQGNYSFTDLIPGEYSVRQQQPDGYFNGGQLVGDGTGIASENLIEGIVIASGQKVTQYDFCEVEAAEIHGRVWEDGPAIETSDGNPVDGYRTMRDGVYQEGVDTPLAGVRLHLYYFIDPVNGSTIPRPVTLGEVDADFYDHIGTNDPNAPVWVDTMADGEYWFQGLQAGNYIVLQDQPSGYYDSNDTAGTTTGFSYNSLEATNAAPQSVISTFSTEQIMDSVVNIRVNAGGISELNNFSEVRFTSNEDPNPPNPPQPPEPPQPPRRTPPTPGITSHPGLYGAQLTSFTQFVGTATGIAGGKAEAVGGSSVYSWHLSVINAGHPRGIEDGVQQESVWQTAGYIGDLDWSRFDMDDAVWTFTQTDGQDGDISITDQQVRFGMIDGTPLAGDFDGDGTDEVAVFQNGYWLIDINRNGVWDDADLLARLGDAQDQPVVGDWDGDGKDDIGIYGPIWERDREAILRDPGLPNPDNDPYTTPKNVPPVDEDATNGARVMKLTSHGKQRADVIDHVFGVGDENLIAVTGDWNGNGIRSIGTFENGVWNLDVNGDGRFDSEDATVRFGQAGDVPVVGDFNGDGVEEIAVYRSGSWMIDSNGNRELDATDKTFQLGESGDLPVVGDWDGDGTDEPGIYHQDRQLRFD